MKTFIGNEDGVHAFVEDLLDLLKKHNVWMIANLDDNGTPRIEFNCQSNINDPDNTDCLWFLEAYDFWPRSVSSLPRTSAPDAVASKSIFTI